MEFEQKRIVPTRLFSDGLSEGSSDSFLQTTPQTDHLLDQWDLSNLRIEDCLSRNKKGKNM